MTKFVLPFLVLAAGGAVSAEQWKTFSDPKIGIQMQYPATWTHRTLDSPSGRAEIFDDNSLSKTIQGDFEVASYAVNTKKLPLDQYFEDYKKWQSRNDGLKVSNVRKGKVGGHTAIIFSLAGREKIQPTQNYYIGQPGDKIFIISVTLRNGAGKNPSALAEKVISTVKFLKG